MPRQGPASPSPSPSQPCPLDPKIWRACAGGLVEIPTVNSRVYYFAQGHFDQASSPPRNIPPVVFSKSFTLCRVDSVQFLADHLTDEVFAKLTLQPINDYFTAEPSVVPPAQKDDGMVISFAKILTPSDANNGGGFSVPRFCADSIFPPLNFVADPPVQNLFVADLHGFVWEFRHIYRGTPRRHLLTTGWSKYVNKKNLIAGDSVIFMKNSSGNLFVGIRRSTRLAFDVGNCPLSGKEEEEEEEKEEEEAEEKKVFSRNGKGRLSAKDVVKAAELAAQNKPFEVVYYPKAGWSEFVVKAETVDEAMRIAWFPGMRVKMAMETDDSSRMTWFQGTLTSVSFSNNGQWRYCPWRMLQITWDEPEVLQNAKWVSPWQVELVSTHPALHPAFPSAKRFRAAHGSEVITTDGEGNPFSIFRNSAMGHLNHTLFSVGTLPAGMQGARHDVISASTISNYPSEMSHLCTGNSFGNSRVPRLKTSSREINVGSSQSEELSSDSRSSLHSCGTEIVGNNDCNSNSVRLVLFGNVIPVSVENGLDGTGCTGDNGCTYTQLLDKLDEQWRLGWGSGTCDLDRT
ncbi:Auxin response factor 17, partial [Mucuna pruriens]